MAMAKVTGYVCVFAALSGETAPLRCYVFKSLALQLANQRANVDTQVHRRLALAAAQVHRPEDHLAFEMLYLQLEVLLRILFVGQSGIH